MLNKIKSSKKVLLINPNWKKSKETIWHKVASVYPPLGLLNIAGVLKRERHAVEFLDMSAENISAEELSVSNSYDIVGITVTTPLLKPALLVAQKIKNNFPDTMIVFGGVHATIAHEELIKHDFVDVVVREEGEMAMLEICDDTPLPVIEGITYIHNCEVIVNESRAQLEDLDWLPYIPYELLKINLYRPPVGGYRRLPAFMMITGRNCPNDCTYCQHYHRKVRTRSAKRIFEEIEFIYKSYGIREINFYDDTFTVFKKNVNELCDLLINSDFDITWSCFTRVNAVDFDLLKKMKEAGCHTVLFGVESSNEAILKAMRKNINLDDVKKAVDLCRKAGIKTRCSYILGYPGETEETMKETLEYSKFVNSDFVQFNAITAYPGTELWKQAHDNNWLIESEDWDMSNCNIQTPLLSRGKVISFYKESHGKYYLRPKVILRRFFAIRSYEDLKQELVGALAILGF